MKLVVILLLLGLYACNEASNELKTSIQLIDYNFDDVTQSATNSESGNWFVNFCDSKNNNCKQFEPLWNELSKTINSKVSIATANLRLNKQLKRRFKMIRRLPTIWLLSQGTYYEYNGKLEIEPLIEFATKTYTQSKKQGKIPDLPSEFDKFWKIISMGVEDSGGIMNLLMMKDEDGYVNMQAVIIIYAIPISTLTIVTYLLFVKVKQQEPLDDDTESSEDKKSKKTKKMSQQVSNPTDTSQRVRSPFNSTKKPNGGHFQDGMNDVSMMGASTMNETAADMMTLGRNLKGSSSQLTQNRGSMLSGQKQTAASGQINANMGSPQKSSISPTKRMMSLGGSAQRSRSSSGGGGSCQRRRRSTSGEPDSQERAFIYPCQAFKQFLLSMNKEGVNINDFASSPLLMEYMNYNGERGRSSDPKPFSASLRQSSQPNRSNSRSKLNSKSQLTLAEGLNYNQPKDSIIEEDEGEDQGVSNNAKHSRGASFGVKQVQNSNSSGNLDANNKYKKASTTGQPQNSANNHNSNSSNSKQKSNNNPSNSITSNKIDTRSDQYNNQRSPLKMTSTFGQVEDEGAKPLQKVNQRSPIKVASSKMGASNSGNNNLNGGNQANQRSPLKMTSSIDPIDESGSKTTQQLNNKPNQQSALQNVKGGDKQQDAGRKHNFNQQQQDKPNANKSKDALENGSNQKSNALRSSIPTLETSNKKERRDRNQRSGSDRGSQGNSDEEQVYFKGSAYQNFEQDQRFDDKGKLIKSNASFKNQQSLPIEKQLTKNDSIAKNQNLVGAIDKDFDNDHDTNRQNRQRRGRQQRSSMGGDMSSAYDEEEEQNQNGFSPYHEPRSVNTLPIPNERENTPLRSAKNTNPHKSIANQNQNDEDDVDYNASRFPLVGNNADFSEDEIQKQFDSNDFRSKQRSPVKVKYYQEDAEDQLDSDHDQQFASKDKIDDDSQESDKGIKQQNPYSTATIGMGNPTQKKTPGRGERRKDAKGNNMDQSRNQDNEIQKTHSSGAGSNNNKVMAIDLSSDADSAHGGEEELLSYNASPKDFKNSQGQPENRGQSPIITNLSNQKRKTRANKDASAQPNYQSGTKRDETVYNPVDGDLNDLDAEADDNKLFVRQNNKDKSYDSKGQPKSVSDINDRENSHDESRNQKSPYKRNKDKNGNQDNYKSPDQQNNNGKIGNKSDPKNDKQNLNDQSNGSPEAARNGDVEDPKSGQSSASKQRRGRHNRGSPSQEIYNSLNNPNPLDLQDETLRQAIPTNFEDDANQYGTRKLSPINKDKNKMLSYKIDDDDDGLPADIYSSNANSPKGKSSDQLEQSHDSPPYQKQQKQPENYEMQASSLKKKQPRRERNNAGARQNNSNKNDSNGSPTDNNNNFPNQIYDSDGNPVGGEIQFVEERDKFKPDNDKNNAYDSDGYPIKAYNGQDQNNPFNQNNDQHRNNGMGNGNPSDYNPQYYANEEGEPENNYQSPNNRNDSYPSNANGLPEGNNNQNKPYPQNRSNNRGKPNNSLNSQNPNNQYPQNQANNNGSPSNPNLNKDKDPSNDGNSYSPNTGNGGPQTRNVNPKNRDGNQNPNARGLPQNSNSLNDQNPNKRDNEYSPYNGGGHQNEDPSNAYDNPKHQHDDNDADGSPSNYNPSRNTKPTYDGNNNNLPNNGGLPQNSNSLNNQNPSDKNGNSPSAGGRPQNSNPQNNQNPAKNDLGDNPNNSGNPQNNQNAANPNNKNFDGSKGLPLGNNPIDKSNPAHNNNKAYPDAEGLAQNADPSSNGNPNNGRNKNHLNNGGSPQSSHYPNGESPFNGEEEGKSPQGNTGLNQGRNDPNNTDPNNSNNKGPQSLAKKQPNKQSQSNSQQPKDGKATGEQGTNPDGSEVKQPTKFKELEKELKKQISENPTKPLNYALLLDIQGEAAKTIQRKFKETKIKVVEEEVIVRDGVADRSCQTEPLIAGLPNNLMLNDEKFKKFMTAMLYSYKMVNNALSDGK